jgi:AraC family transcriptional regulator
LANAHNWLDAAPTPSVRVRGWAHRGPSVPDWPSNAHAAVEVAWVDEGALTYEIAGQVHRAGPGEVMVVPSGVEHRTRLSPGVRAGSIWLAPELVCEIAEAAGHRGHEAAGLARRAGRICALGRWILDEAAHPSADQLLAIDALCESLAIEVLRQSVRREDATSARDPRIRSAVDRIETCYAEALSVDELARVAAMSRFHFSRLFREQTGKSPYRFLLETRVRKAACLLRAGHGVTEAALSVGFSDLSRFGQMFRRQLGASPSAFRRTARFAARMARSA